MKNIFIVVALAFVSSTSFAWSNHYLVTRAALSELQELKSQKVKPTTFQSLIESLGFADKLTFNTALQIHKSYDFGFFMNEKPEAEVAVLDVLSKYSDEPDWGMDKELFGDDQYPELWNDAYSMMGGKKGTPSQAFRHMYWRKISLHDPVATFKLPFPKNFSNLGEAPNRAAIFMDLSRKAAQKGHVYWAFRFIANALHYLEDVSQPFHSVQTPTKKFIVMPFTDKLGSGTHEFVKQAQNIVAYYHFGFEDYIGRIMKDLEKGVVHPEAVYLNKLLAGTESGYPSSLDTTFDVKELTKSLANLATTKAARAGRATVEFFPEITVPYVEFDPNKFMDEKWWEAVLLKGQQPSKAREAYFSVVREMFYPLGVAIRRVVGGESRAHLLLDL